AEAMELGIPEVRSREVVSDDLVGRPAVERVAVGAVLGEADSVTPAMADDEQHRQRLRASRACVWRALRRVLRERLMRRGGTGEPEGCEDGCCDFGDHRLDEVSAARAVLGTGRKPEV